MECIKNGKHIGKMEEIFSTAEDHMSDAVVRWCPICGAVTVDIDYDGRTNPGQIMKMRFPKHLTSPRE